MQEVSIVQTYLTYGFHQGIAPDTTVSVSFDYLDKAHVKVSVNDKLLTDNRDYNFDTKGTLRILRSFDGICLLSVRRITPPEQNMLFALEELRDEISIKNTEISEKINSFKAELSALVSQETLLRENSITALNNSLLSEITLLRSSLDNTAETTAVLKTDIRILQDILSNLQQSYALLSESQQTAKDEAAETFNTLSAWLETVESQLSENTETLNNQANYFKNRLADVENYSFEQTCSEELQRAISYWQSEFNKLKERTEPLLKETRSALNIETQVRRREDAQIKALFKRLLGKYERLESWIAGNEPDISASIIEEFKQQLQFQDDVLGRVHLENIVRINALKELLLKKGV